MKNIIIFISLLFATVCYAAPPPDVGATLTDEVAYVSNQDQVQVEISVMDAAVQEVAFNCIGNPYLFTGYEAAFEAPGGHIGFSELPEIYVDQQLIALNKPPSFYSNEAGIKINRNRFAFQRDAQNSNFGYPFTAE